MIWIRDLYPEESRDQLEAARVMVFTLIPLYFAEKGYWRHLGK